MEYMSTKEAAEKWGYCQSTIAGWCRDKKILVIIKPEKINGRWRIPIEAECPKKVKKTQER